jgi:hypothetical protein
MLAIGQKWRTREGKVVEIVVERGSAVNYPWIGSNSYWYTDMGLLFHGKRNKQDLIELIEEKPKMKLILEEQEKEPVVKLGLCMRNNGVDVVATNVNTRESISIARFTPDGNLEVPSLCATPTARVMGFQLDDENKVKVI